jgi:hypothetical protein
MRSTLAAAALLTMGLFASGTANAAPLAGATSLSPEAQQGTVQKVDFRGFRHCHGPRWDRTCHSGGGRLFFRDLNRRWDRWGDDDGRRGRRYRDRDRDYDRDRY